MVVKSSHLIEYLHWLPYFYVGYTFFIAQYYGYNSSPQSMKTALQATGDDGSLTSGDLDLGKDPYSYLFNVSAIWLASFAVLFLIIQIYKSQSSQKQTQENKEKEQVTIPTDYQGIQSMSIQ